MDLGGQWIIVSLIKQWLATAAAVPDVVPLFEQINTSPGTWDATIDLGNPFFSIPINKVHQKQSAFSWKGKQYTFTVLPQGYINSLALCRNLVLRDLYCLFLQGGISLVPYIDDFMLIGCRRQEVATPLDLLVRQLGARKWEVNPTKLQCTSTSLKFPGMYWCVSCWNIPL